jgi:small conductance mechanosensitive channel
VSPPLVFLLLQAGESFEGLPPALSNREEALSILVRSGLVLLLTYVVATRVRHWFERVSVATSADANTRLLVGRLLAILVVIIGAGTVLDIVGVPLSALVAFFGVVGLAISLALQDILKNLVAGLYLLFERPFRLGDLITIKDQKGVVETIGIRTTTLRTDENVEILIPNMTVFTDVVTNRTQFRPKPPEPGDSPETSAVPETSQAGPTDSR